MTDRCPHCGQKMRKPAIGGREFEAVSAALAANSRAEWTMTDILAVTGLSRSKAVHNAVNYLVKIGRLQRAYRGVFRVKTES